ncbi:MAG: HDOD domain-containing protein [Nitrospirae bacterium]|nr:HDOD domain-containing protein [Nitrospirota bacterium]
MIPGSDNIKERLFSIRELPTIPAAHDSILKLIDEGNYSLDDLSGLIERDQVLSGKVLKHVNSPFYGLYSKVASVGKAIVLIGSSPIRGIILSTSLFNIADKELPGMWDHSYCCSLVSGFLANRFNMKDIGEIITAALLHDIGKVLIRKQLAEESAEIDKTAQSDGIPMIDAEKMIIDVTHDAVGSWLAGQWNFPSIIKDIIAYHHKPGLCRAYSKEAAIVHLSDIIVKGIGVAPPMDRFVPLFDEQGWKKLALPEDELTDILSEVIDIIEAESSFSQYLSGRKDER